MAENLVLKEEKAKRIKISLPIKSLGLQSNTFNLEYAIKELQARRTENFVIGYYLMRGWGTRQMYHEILPIGLAEEKKREDDRYKYVSLEGLLKREKEVKESGKYEILDDGRIIYIRSVGSNAR